MRSIKFPQANTTLAESQDEYETLHAHAVIDVNGKPELDNEGNLKDGFGQMTCCFELNKEEIEEIVKTGQIWFTQCTFWNGYNPINMSTQNPFKPQDNA